MFSIILGSIAILAALKVITDQNTVHSVFYLVLAFIASSLNLIDHGVDYLGLLLIIVYVGAIAIFFLFVVMMINIKHEETNRTKYVPIGLIVALVLMIEIKSHVFSPITSEVSTDISLNEVSNMKSIGMILYSWDIIIYASLVLLVAMIGAIVLTLSHSEGVKRQDLYNI